MKCFAEPRRPTRERLSSLSSREDDDEDDEEDEEGIGSVFGGAEEDEDEEDDDGGGGEIHGKQSAGERDDEPETVDDGDSTRIYKNPRNSPSALCPRDEAQATLMGQTCLRKCSSDEDCKSKRKKCLCDGACGMSCIKPGRR
ncbi:hypothetical protein J437_LFUL001344, partial [Ladona fulva]